MKLRLEVVYRKDDYTKQLEQELKAAQKKVAELEKKVTGLEFRYAGIMNVNFEMIDLLKANGIKFRDISALKNPHW